MEHIDTLDQQLTDRNDLAQKQKRCIREVGHLLWEMCDDFMYLSMKIPILLQKEIFKETTDVVFSILDPETAQYAYTGTPHHKHYSAEPIHILFQEFCNHPQIEFIIQKGFFQEGDTHAFSDSYSTIHKLRNSPINKTIEPFFTKEQLTLNIYETDIGEWTFLTLDFSKWRSKELRHYRPMLEGLFPYLRLTCETAIANSHIRFWNNSPFPHYYPSVTPDLVLSTVIPKLNATLGPRQRQILGQMFSFKGDEHLIAEYLGITVNDVRVALSPQKMGRKFEKAGLIDLDKNKFYGKAILEYLKETFEEYRQISALNMMWSTPIRYNDYLRRFEGLGFELHLTSELKQILARRPRNPIRAIIGAGLAMG